MVGCQHSSMQPFQCQAKMLTVFVLTPTCGFNYHTDMSIWHSFSHLFLGNRGNHFICQIVRIFANLFSRSPSAHHLTPCSFHCHQKRQITKQNSMHSFLFLCFSGCSQFVWPAPLINSGLHQASILAAQ